MNLEPSPGAVRPNVLQAGRMAAICVANDPDRGDCGTVYLRTIAHALERHMNSLPESSIHWVAVIDEASSFGRPTRLWTFDDCLLQVGLVQGNSEGMLIYVHAQADRHSPAQLVPLLRVKVLCGPSRAMGELQTVWNWLHSQEFRLLTEPKAAAEQTAAAAAPATAAMACRCTACPPDAVVCQQPSAC